MLTVLHKSNSLQKLLRDSQNQSLQRRTHKKKGSTGSDCSKVKKNL